MNWRHGDIINDQSHESFSVIRSRFEVEFSHGLRTNEWFDMVWQNVNHKLTHLNISENWRGTWTWTPARNRIPNLEMIIFGYGSHCWFSAVSILPLTSAHAACNHGDETIFVCLWLPPLKAMATKTLWHSNLLVGSLIMAYFLSTPIKLGKVYKNNNSHNVWTK